MSISLDVHFYDGKLNHHEWIMAARNLSDDETKSGLQQLNQQIEELFEDQEMKETKENRKNVPGSVQLFLKLVGEVHSFDDKNNIHPAKLWVYLGQKFLLSILAKNADGWRTMLLEQSQDLQSGTCPQGQITRLLNLFQGYV